MNLLLILLLPLTNQPVVQRRDDQQQFKNDLGMIFKKIPAGTFEMGPSGSADPGYIKLFGVVHRVTLSSFWMSQYLTTNKQFEKFRKRKRPPSSPGDNTPIVEIRRKDALAFATWLSRREKRHYALPTEAQWEYAARGGLKGMNYPWGNEDPDGRASFGRTVCEDVGSYAPNGYGLYDMVGDAEEFVREFNYPYKKAPQKDPVGPMTGDTIVLRGGGQGFELKVFERDDNWDYYEPKKDLSFRLVCLDR